MPDDKPAFLRAADAPVRARPTIYPEPFASRVRGREKRPLGDVFGLTTFGVNLTRLAPGAQTALLHAHTRQDEMVYVLEGTPTLVTGGGEAQLAPGDCAGFKAGGAAHCLVNRSAADVVILEIGDRGPGDAVEYPRDDLAATLGPDGSWRVTHKDGTPY